MTVPGNRIRWQNSAWRVRQRRRQLARHGKLLSPMQFCEQKGISRDRLLELERRGKVFAVVVDQKRYFPAVLADNSLDQRRLGKLLRRLPSAMPPMSKYLFLGGRRGSLADKSPLQATRRGKRYRVALRLAESIASEYGHIEERLKSVEVAVKVDIDDL